ncbi:MAG: FAD-dependent monooxygenase [Burkholderiaceae bacterium]
MQYHLDGFQTGDPNINQPAQNRAQSPDRVDVLIVGCGPAGLTLAAQLSQFADISVRIVERKPGRLEIGQADGIACRSMEMFEAFGFAEKVAKEAYWVNEVTFWRPGSDGATLGRADRIQDVEDGLSEFPHTILNQARVHDFYLEVMKTSATRLEPDYNLELSRVDLIDGEPYPVVATFNRVDEERQGSTQTVRARYLVGCDGARSQVRKSLGLELKGESARQLWGVMDVLAVTDFPDIRRKCAIQSAEHGSVMIIPREGGYMARLYIELDELLDDERAADRNVSADALIRKAQTIFSPYLLDIKEVSWWSAYEIGQRVCDAFDNTTAVHLKTTTPHIFIAGDACHTHSPKAGQGMNVSMADAFNLGWKLAAVVRGSASPNLLRSYSEERQAKAKELIEFDKDMARLFSEKPKSSAEAEQFQRYFQKHSRYTAGVETRYDPSIITMDNSHQPLATGLTIGMRFHSAPVIRLADARPLHLGHVLKADGRWRLIAFAPDDDRGDPGGKIAALCAFLADDANSPIRRHTRPTQDIDACIDVRAVFQAGHRDLELETMPQLLKPSKGKFGLVDYEKVFCADLHPGSDIFEIRGINRTHGALLVVRPDQFVAGVLPLSDYDALAKFFAGFMKIVS